MPADTDITAKLLDAKVAVIVRLLKDHPVDEAVGILENAKIELEAIAEFEEKRAEVASKIAAFNAKAVLTA